MLIQTNQLDGEARAPAGRRQALDADPTDRLTGDGRLVVVLTSRAADPATTAGPCPAIVVRRPCLWEHAANVRPRLRCAVGPPPQPADTAHRSRAGDRRNHRTAARSR